MDKDPISEWISKNLELIRNKYPNHHMLIHPEKGVVISAITQEVFGELLKGLSEPVKKRSRIYHSELILNDGFYGGKNELVEKIKELKKNNVKITPKMKEEFLASLSLEDFETTSRKGAIAPKREIRQLLGYSK